MQTQSRQLLVEIVSFSIVYKKKGIQKLLDRKYLMQATKTGLFYCMF